VLLPALGLTALMPAARGATPATVPQSDLQACASIAADAERLACYDRIAGRSAPGVAPSVSKASPAATGPAVAASAPAVAATAPAVAVTAPAVSARAPAVTATAPAGTTAPAVTGSSATAAATAPAASAAQTFGLYAAEHPKPAVTAAPALEARVAALGSSASGHMTVRLEGGALWELDDKDPLLSVGETVTIVRAALGSYVMHTASRRTHRVRRLQ
jgi:hypothetical protein